MNDRLKLKMMRLAVPVTLVAAACATESKRNEQLKTTTAETGTAVEAGKICTIVARAGPRVSHASRRSRSRVSPAAEEGGQ